MVDGVLQRPENKGIGGDRPYFLGRVLGFKSLEALLFGVCRE
jgi:hypothetical protein